MNTLPRSVRFQRLTCSGALALAAALVTTTVRAQDPGPRGRDGGRGANFVRMNPLFAALDANRDGTIDEEELKNATAALQKLDRNNDGKLTEDEVRPAFGRGGPGGPGGPGAPNPEEMVGRMMQFDKDADGRLSKEEVPERMQRMFERGDANKDGFLSREELLDVARLQAERGRPEGEGRRRNEDRR